MTAIFLALVLLTGDAPKGSPPGKPQAPAKQEMPGKPAKEKPTQPLISVPQFQYGELATVIHKTGNNGTVVTWRASNVEYHSKSLLGLFKSMAAEEPPLLPANLAVAEARRFAEMTITTHLEEKGWRYVAAYDGVENKFRQERRSYYALLKRKADKPPANPGEWVRGSLQHRVGEDGTVSVKWESDTSFTSGKTLAEVARRLGSGVRKEVSEVELLNMLGVRGHEMYNTEALRGDDDILRTFYFRRPK